MHVPLNESGNVLKFLIAAKYNYSASCSSLPQNFTCSAHPLWPTITITRTVFSVSTRAEPRPSGYLNVFEYDLKGINVQVGDVVHIQLPRPPSPETSKYLLAYLGSSQSMVSLVTTLNTDSEDSATDSVYTLDDLIGSEGYCWTVTVAVSESINNLFE